MKKKLNLTNSQIKLLLDCLQLIISIQKMFNPKKFTTENELHKIAEYVDLYEIIAEQYYDDKNIFKKIS